MAGLRAVTAMPTKAALTKLVDYIYPLTVASDTGIQ